MATYSVLSGEVLDSEHLKLPERKKMQRNLSTFFTQFEEKDRNALNLKFPFELSRGERFQVLIDTPSEALRVALLIRAFLKSDFYSGQKLDARIGIGAGKIESSANTRLSEAEGEAFDRADELLNTPGKLQRLTIFSAWPDLDRELNVGFILLETITSRWTPTQADVIYLKLMGKIENEISSELGITQSAVNQRSNAACWPAIDAFVKRYAELMKSR
ncbi:MAG: SatD family protein [Siphonobacter sp.]